MKELTGTRETSKVLEEVPILILGPSLGRSSPETTGASVSAIFAGFTAWVLTGTPWVEWWERGDGQRRGKLGKPGSAVRPWHWDTTCLWLKGTTQLGFSCLINN